MEPIKWFDRKFDFNFTENIFPVIVERLRATPLRLSNMISLIQPGYLETRIDNTWSIKENIGHLTDLEPLWQRRLNDIISGEEFMTVTDLANTKTEMAGHNLKTIEELQSEFSAVRNKTLAILENLDEQIIFKSSLHPRLKTPMRTIDLFLFVAEHDDHHLAKIKEIEKLFQNPR
jgi:uncharacterized damage-inducible protein DinB